jgi:large subunit ribosomal protein L16
MPKRVKYRKFQRGKIKEKSTSGNYVAFGDFGLMSMQMGMVSATQLEAARVVCSRYMGGVGKYWIRVFPHKSMTARAAETRMGKGKGEVVKWVATVRPGTILFELGGVDESAARDIFRRQAGKLCVKTKMVKRRPAL